ncbi:unnamed protein product [Dovyalis caffra]|uniref:Uncharacterized protein n=1 Tax=Dovyalis caffra TaxID=77055 RepID=A0AAV1QWN0_9ROSI|nr:unnamed protein product [Dovyalis caffra]
MSGINNPSGVSGGASTGPGSGAGAPKDGTMKAPGQDVCISREGFEKNPAGYFQEENASDLHILSRAINGNPCGFRKDERNCK